LTDTNNNGFAEGVNLKIKMLNRRRYGYRNFTSFCLHVLVAFDPLFRRKTGKPGLDSMTSEIVNLTSQF
jgi:hypothetical protein